MILSPWQNTVAEDLHRFRVVNVGRRAGKTTLAIEEIKGKAMAKPNKIAYVAPTYQQARDIAWEELKKQLKPVFASPPNESRLEIKVKTQMGGESIVSLRGWESIETLRGQSFDFIVIDEVAMMREFWVNWQEVIRPTLTDRKGEVMFISTPKGFNHFYDLHNLEAKDKDYKSFHFTSYDNPHLDKEELDKARAEITDTRFSQEYLADFRKVEGLVYKDFSRDRHLYETLDRANKHFEYLGGVDFGFTNPCAVLHVYKDANGEYFVDNEWYQRGRTENQVSNYVLSCKFNAVYPDPENPSGIKTLADVGVPIREVVKNKDSVVNGINKVRDLLKQNKLHINKQCLNLIGEFESYAYPDGIGNRESENPIKENDHALDALRYIIYSDFIIRRKIIAEKPRTIIAESRYEGTIPVSPQDVDEVTEQELAKM